MALPLSNRIAVFLLFLVTTGLLLYFLLAGIDRAVDPVTLLPVDTVVMVDLKQPVSHIHRLKKSRLGNRVSAIVQPEILREINLPDDDIGYFINISGKLKKMLNSPFFSELFSRRVVLGILPARHTPASPGSGYAGLEQNLVLIARPRHRAALVDVFADFYIEFEYASESYKGREVKTFDYDRGTTFSATVIDGLVVAAFSDAVIKRCIDNAIRNRTTGGSGLQDSGGYRQLKGRTLGRDDQFVYVNVPELRQMLAGIIIPRSPLLPIGYDDLHQAGGLEYMKRVALFRQSDKKIMQHWAIVQYNKEHPGLRNIPIHRHSPEHDTILGILPENNVIHLWVNVFDPGRLWDFFREKDNAALRSVLRSLERLIAARTGMTMEELLACFGNKASINVAEMRSTGMFPMPRISVYLEVLDRERVGRALAGIGDGLQVRKGMVAGKEVYSIILAGGIMQPSYMFYDDYLVLADTRKQLEDLLSGRRNTLLKYPLFKKVDVGLTGSNNFVLYYRNAELIDGLKELVRWYGSLLQLFDSSSEARNRVILEKMVLPVIDGLKMYKVKTARAYSLDGEMVLQMSQLVQ